MSLSILQRRIKVAADMLSDVLDGWDEDATYSQDDVALALDVLRGEWDERIQAGEEEKK